MEQTQSERRRHGGSEKPPPQVEFDPKMMPKDWEGTWGEVTMAYWLGVIDQQIYQKLHKAAHPDSCKHD
ncbi:MAG: hypothetical protein DRI90_03555 [Deltaproteobacteria bacterium]|nr:MAG: hypothetical protein DRI90_03555 [Deltaproteobacteria bacterium]